LWSDSKPNGLDLVFFKRLDPVRGPATDTERSNDIVQATALSAQPGDCQRMAAPTIGTIQRPAQEVLDDAEPVIECTGIGSRSISVRAKFGRKGLDLTAVQHLASSQEVVQIETRSLFRPDVEAAENPKVAYQGGRLNPVSAVPDRPSRPHANGKPSSGINHARQALAVFQNHPQRREWSLDAGSRFRHELIRRLNGGSVVRKSKVDKMDTTRSNP
jgi:hypothetical protein